MFSLNLDRFDSVFNGDGINLLSYIIKVISNNYAHWQKKKKKQQQKTKKKRKNLFIAIAFMWNSLVIQRNITISYIT